MKKRCIYHVPYPITNESNAASKIRPRKMLEAFQRNFDEVFVISGYGKERSKKFKRLKKRVSHGIKYEFMYSESSTMPNLITEKNHMPFYPFLERNIFKYCKTHDIPIGLFYRDVHWKFAVYKQTVDFWKRCITLPLYHFDMAIYNKYITIMYLPSMEMKKYVDFKGRIEMLPPGSGYGPKQKEDRYNKQLELFYVGGVGGIYDIYRLIEGVRVCEFTHLTLCCPKEPWENWSKQNKIVLPRNISIIHKQGEELEEYYKKADLGMLFLPSSGYDKIAMPVKLFEYIEHCLPVVACKNCAFGDYVADNDIGWEIDHNIVAFAQLLSQINDDREMLNQKKERTFEVAKKNTWDVRALSVFNDLKCL